MTKWPVQKTTHRTTQTHVEYQDATNIYKLLYFCVFQSYVVIIIIVIKPKMPFALNFFCQ